MAARMRSSQPVRADGRPVSQLGRPQQGQIWKMCRPALPFILIDAEQRTYHVQR